MPSTLFGRIDRRRGVDAPPGDRRGRRRAGGQRRPRPPPRDGDDGIRPRLGRGTSALVVADRDGNVVVVTQTLSTWGGSFYVSPGLGFLYNNHLRMARARRGHAGRADAARAIVVGQRLDDRLPRGRRPAGAAAGARRRRQRLDRAVGRRGDPGRRRRRARRAGGGRSAAAARRRERRRADRGSLPAPPGRRADPARPRRDADRRARASCATGSCRRWPSARSRGRSRPAPIRAARTPPSPCPDAVGAPSRRTLRYSAPLACAVPSCPAPRPRRRRPDARRPPRLPTPQPADGRRCAGDAGRGVAPAARREVDAPARLRAEGRREVRGPLRGRDHPAADDAAQRLLPVRRPHHLGRRLRARPRLPAAGRRPAPTGPATAPAR